MSEGEIPATLTIALDPPVVVNKVEFAEIVLREPTLSQVRDAHMKIDDAVSPSPGSMRDYELTFVAGVSGKGRPIVEELPVRALRAAVIYLERWIGAELPDAPGENETDLVIALDPPLRSNGGEVHELVLREPKAGELRKAEDLLGKQASPLPGPVRKYQAKLIEQVTGLGPLVVGQLPISKSKEAMRFLEGFEKSAQETGRK